MSVLHRFSILILDKFNIFNCSSL